MGQTFQKLCEPHFWAIFITIAVMILLFAAGVGLKSTINAILKKWSGPDVDLTVNVGKEAAEELNRHRAATIDESAKHDERMGDIMPERSEFYRLLRENMEKDIGRVDKRVDTLWEHHEALEKEMLGKIEALGKEMMVKIEVLGKDASARHDSLKEGIYNWKKEVLENQKSIVGILKEIKGK